MCPSWQIWLPFLVICQMWWLNLCTVLRQCWSRSNWCIHRSRCHAGKNPTRKDIRCLWSRDMPSCAAQLYGPDRRPVRVHIRRAARGSRIGHHRSTGQQPIRSCSTSYPHRSRRSNLGDRAWVQGHYICILLWVQNDLSVPCVLSDHAIGSVHLSYENQNDSWNDKILLVWTSRDLRKAFILMKSLFLLSVLKKCLYYPSSC